MRPYINLTLTLTHANNLLRVQSLAFQYKVNSYASLMRSWLRRETATAVDHLSLVQPIPRVIVLFT